MHRNASATLLAAAIALFSTGCERALFAYVNRGTPPPSTTARYAPDRDLALDVYRPAANTSRAPTVVFFYGGAWKRGERAQYAFVGRRLADAGMLALVPDYRTYPKGTFPDFMRDAADAVAWARAHAAEHGGDPQRIFLAGHSAGAQIAALLATDARYLKRVDLAPRDLSGVIGLSGPYDFMVGQTYAPIFGPPARWPEAQAVNYVSGDEPPFLLVHGTADRVVEAVDSAQLDEKLRAAGVSSTLLWLEGAGHSAPLAGFYQDRRAPQVLPAVERFVSAH